MRARIRSGWGHVVFSSDPAGFLGIVEPFLQSVFRLTSADSEDTSSGPTVGVHATP